MSSPKPRPRPKPKPNKGPRKDNNSQNKSLLRGLSLLSQIGFTVSACVITGVFLGKYLDELLNTSPWLLLLCSLLGVGAAFKALFELGGRK